MSSPSEFRFSIVASGRSSNVTNTPGSPRRTPSARYCAANTVLRRRGPRHERHAVRRQPAPGDRVQPRDPGRDASRSTSTARRHMRSTRSKSSRTCAADTCLEPRSRSSTSTALPTSPNVRGSSCPRCWSARPRRRCAASSVTSATTPRSCTRSASTTSPANSGADGDSVPSVAMDCTYRLRIPHTSGQLARVAGTIAEQGGLIGDVTTILIARHEAVREITVELRDKPHAEALAAALSALPGVAVSWYHDRAFIAHEGGKLEVVARREIRTNQDVRDVYTPGVARVSTAIAEFPELAGRFTMIGRSVAICTNGTRVLGLGDIGPVASMPVMEGKALFYAQLVGVSAVPVLVDTKDVDEFVETVVRIAPGFGGIHLEDIRAPDCFEIEARLIDALPQPVMHDDVHGTAVVTFSAAIAGCRQVGKRLDEAVVGQVGLGAAGYGIGTLIHDAGVRRVIAADPSPDAQQRARERGIEIADLETVMREADVVVATSGRPGLIAPDMIRRGQVILALTNPDPEIEPDVALAAGAAFAADGTSVNNVLGYPGIFRGALLAGADAVNLEMKRAAAWALAGLTVESELVPNVLDRGVHEAVADAVRLAAIDSGVGHPDRAPTHL